MNKRRSKVEEEETEEETENEDERSGILKDGQSVRVSLFMRDGSTINPDLTPTQRGKAMAAQQTEDAIARRFGLSDGMQLHRPGFRRVTDAAALERSRAAYAAYDATDGNAWKGDARGQQAGDVCTSNGAPGHLRQVNGKFECVPDQRQDAGIDAKAAAYEAYDREMSQAYLRGK